MKTKICIITLTLMLLLSCRQTDEKKNKPLDKKQPAVKTFEQKEKEH